MRRAIAPLALALISATGAHAADADGIRRFLSISEVAPVMCSNSPSCVEEEKARALRMFKPLHDSASGSPKLQAAMEEHYAAVISQLDQLLPNETDTRRVFQDRRESAKKRVEEAKSRVQTQLDLAK